MISVSLSMVHDCNLKFCFQSKVEEINSQLNQEYTLRRSMLLKRLDVTVRSFGWSDRAKVSMLQATDTDCTIYLDHLHCLSGRQVQKQLQLV